MLFLDDLLNIQCRLKYFEKKSIDGIGEFIGGYHLADILTVLKNRQRRSPITTDFQLIGKSL